MCPKAYLGGSMKIMFFIMSFALVLPCFAQGFNSSARRDAWEKRFETIQSARNLALEARYLYQVIARPECHRLSNVAQEVTAVLQAAELFAREVDNIGHDYNQCYGGSVYAELRRSFLQLRFSFHRELEIPGTDFGDDAYYLALSTYTRFALEFKKLHDLLEIRPVVIQPQVIIVPQNRGPQFPPQLLPRRIEIPSPVPQQNPQQNWQGNQGRRGGRRQQGQNNGRSPHQR